LRVGSSSRSRSSSPSVVVIRTCRCLMRMSTRRRGSPGGGVRVGGGVAPEGSMGADGVVVGDEVVELALEAGDGRRRRLGGEPAFLGLVEAFDFAAGLGVVGAGVGEADPAPVEGDPERESRLSVDDLWDWERHRHTIAVRRPLLSDDDVGAAVPWTRALSVTASSPSCRRSSTRS
jgi:hypothetical protein